MIVSLEEKVVKKDWVENTNQYNEEGITESDLAKNKYLIVESKEGYEFIIEVDNEKETAEIQEINRTPGEKYTITYHPNGGIGEARPVEVKRGFYKILENNTFTKTDYIFGGWCEEPEPNEEAKIYLEGSKYKPEKDVTLYAVWTYNVGTIKFDANEGTGKMEDKKVTKGDIAKLPVNTFTREDYDFVKWNTKADGTGKDYANSGDIILTEDNITLYAVWKEKLKVANAIKNQIVFEDNTPIPDSYGNKVIIPEGFKIASDSAENVTGGIVIEDVKAGNETTKGSQFVWIPVGKVIKQNGTETINLDRYTFELNSGTPQRQGTSEINNYYQERAYNYYESFSGETNVAATNLSAFQPGGSVEKNGGYYIGRYEAGDSSATSWRTSSSKADKSLVCKEDQYVYNYIKQSEAAGLAKGMYTNKKFTSDLINSYAWDTAIVFIQKFSGNTKYSQQTTKLQTTLAKTGKATNGTSKDVKCNIYDMLGNCSEFSTEMNPYSVNPHCVRGGNYGDSRKPDFRNPGIEGGDASKGSFRPILYL